MDAIFQDFLTRYRNDCAYGPDGGLAEKAEITSAIGTDLLLATLAQKSTMPLPAFEDTSNKHLHVAEWLLGLPEEQLKAFQLFQPLPPHQFHFVAGETDLFYDFRNTDIILQEFAHAGAEIEGNFLDFGCSTGRNVATFHAFYGDKLKCYGVDPATSSIDWANRQFPFADFSVNQQNQPLDFPNAHFDLVIAKSIWTHFSEAAAKKWFAEISRVLKPGGHFFFSTHGPHDIAYRLKYNKPSPKYERYTGHEHWTKESFLSAIIEAFDTKGFFFQSFKETRYQWDLRDFKDADTSGWGLAFMLPSFLESELLPADLKIVTRSVGRTGNRHDAYVVQKQ